MIFSSKNKKELGFQPEYLGSGKLFEIAKELHEKKMFLAGPPKWFEGVGRNSLVILLKNGLYPDNKVLDVGCGLLRCGYWIINFLNPNCYYGIEPIQERLELGKSKILDPQILDEKKPEFNFNDEFDFKCFGLKFDFVIARSIWTHADKEQICKMLDSFNETKTKNGIFLTSYNRAGPSEDYKGKSWLGRIDKSGSQGMVKYSFEWIKKECKNRNLEVDEIQDEVINNQIWLRITGKK